MSLRGTGEEWRQMDHEGRIYNPQDHEEIVAAARRSIPNVRMREVELQLVDHLGQPVTHTPVEVLQLRHEFNFGCNLWELDRMFRFGQHEMDRAVCWKKRFTEVFNAANALCYWTERPRNDGPKMEDMQGKLEIDGFAYCVDWATSSSLTVKGHPLFWSIPKAVPQWLMRYDYPTRLKFLEVRIRNLIARFRGRVSLWDAVNEPVWEPAFRNLDQRRWPHLDPVDELAECIEPVLRWAREEDPEGLYIINDYGLEADPQSGPPVAPDGREVTAQMQRSRFMQLIKLLCDRGVPPNALGLQSHTGGWLDHRTQVAVYDELAPLHLPIHITEFWANTDHLKKLGTLSQQDIDDLQAEYVVNYLTCAFGHPSVEAFFFWGFMDAAIDWGEYSAHTLRPLFVRVRDLIHQEWTTRERLVTSSEGVISFKGYYGDYALRYLPGSGDTKQGKKFTVGREQSMPLTLRLQHIRPLD